MEPEAAEDARHSGEECQAPAGTSSQPTNPGEGQEVDVESIWRSFLETAGRFVVVVVPAATFAGYLSWSSAARFMGLTMLKPSLQSIVALGALALTLAGAISLAFMAGWAQYGRSTRMARWKAVALAIGTSALVGAASAYAFVLLVSTTAFSHLDGTLLLVPVVGGALAAAFIGYGAWLDRSSTVSEPASVSTPILTLVIVAAILLAGPATGVIMGPITYQNFGGFAPQPALMEVDSNRSVLLARLHGDARSLAEEDLIIPVWLFATQDGQHVVRHACADQRDGAAYSIPASSVRSIQWLSETSRLRHCGASA